MEIRKNIKDNEFNLSLSDHYLDYFIKSYNFVQKHYKEDFDRIANTKFQNIDPLFFFREYVWVCCASGFNAGVVSGFFPSLLTALEPLSEIILKNDQGVDIAKVKEQALKIFNSTRKIDAIIKTAQILGENIQRFGWETYRNKHLNCAAQLTVFPYIGNTTCQHLGRNIGLKDKVKPDIHLMRLAKNWGFACPDDMCARVKEKYDMDTGLIDLIFWYGASSTGTK